MGRFRKTIDGQPNKVHLNGGCVEETGSVVHEIMHALGFEHEHGRHDRDTYIKINWEKIDEEARK